ncbi:ABC transporter permease subunit [Thermoactinomyces sp. CICC 10523]|uniref:ABC transporter permease subunit n=1 Tax=Thermoactinomyces sp. CICC 10523 TaxID=2767428 RepID=UPI0018DB4729|nr:ABC transporter permease subunit [Thermoactinomyces sp. CICC 10523]MBH8599282.1 hypothetical protein [Thermoactinomyces sp. CICC 10523]
MTKPAHEKIYLWSGLIFLTIFAVMAIIGPFVAPYSPKWEKPLDFKGSTPITAPSPPDHENWFGKDQRGRDFFSLMLYGLRQTLGFVVIVSLVRVTIGGGIGVWIGMAEKGERAKFRFFKRKKHSSMTGFMGSIPAIILLIILLSAPTKYFSYWVLVFVQGIILVFFGVFPVASTIAEQTRQLAGRLSVLVSRVMGASKSWLIRKHILPMLKETFMILFVQDLIVVLNILGQLSLFKIFLGGTEIKAYNAEELKYYSKSFEWVGLIGQNKDWAMSHPYLAWIPLLAYFLLLLSFFLDLKGLEARFQRMYNRYPYL